MSRMKSIAAFGLVLLVSAASLAGDGIAIGETALKTDVKMKNIDGEMVSIADVTGEKGVLVIFTCNQCPWVKGWEIRMATLGNKYQDKGIGVIMINSNDPAVSAEDSFEVMQERAAQRGFEFAYVVDADSSMARAYGAKVTPEAFLFDASGKLVYHGTIDDNMRDESSVTKRYLRDALAATVMGQDVAVQETKSLGCTIKFRKTE